MLEVQRLIAAPPSTVATVLRDTSAALPDGLLADLEKLNGGQPVTTSLAGLVGELRGLLTGAYEKLYVAADVLEEHGYPRRAVLESCRRPAAGGGGAERGACCRRVPGGLEHAHERRVRHGGQSQPDAVDELVLLATEGEVAYALLLEAGYMTGSHRVRGGLQEALAAASRQARRAR